MGQIETVRLTCIHCYTWNRQLEQVYPIELGTLLDILWWPRCEENPKGRGYVYTNGWFTLLCSRNSCNLWGNYTLMNKFLKENEGEEWISKEIQQHLLSPQSLSLKRIHLFRAQLPVSPRECWEAEIKYDLKSKINFWQNSIHFYTCNLYY